MSISWTLYMLGLHEDIQERVRAELDEVLADGSDSSQLPESNLFSYNTHKSQEQQNADELKLTIGKELKITDVTNEHLRKMKYLDRVIKETLRMWPSIPFVARQMTEDLIVGE